MMIAKINSDKQEFFVPGFGYRIVKNLEEFEDNNEFGKALKKYFPHVVYEKVVSEVETIVKEVTKEVKKVEETAKELLLEVPSEVAKVEKEVTKEVEKVVAPKKRGPKVKATESTSK